MIKELTLSSYPEMVDFRNGYVYDRVEFEDKDHEKYEYISINCTANGIPHKNKSKLLLWSWKHDIGDKIIINATFKDGKITRPKLLNKEGE